MSTDLDDGLASVMADVLARGLYDVLPPEHEPWFDDDADPITVRDLHRAACMLRCDRTPRGRNAPLPDVLIGPDALEWLHHDGIGPEADLRERIAAVGREYAQIAALVLSARTASDEDRRSIASIHEAVAVSCDEAAADGSLMVQAATPWSPLSVSRMRPRIEASPEQPDDELLRACPQVVAADMVHDLAGAVNDRPSIRIEAYVTFSWAETRPNPLDVMRTIRDLRGRS